MESAVDLTRTLDFEWTIFWLAWSGATRRMMPWVISIDWEGTSEGEYLDMSVSILHMYV